MLGQVHPEAFVELRHSEVWRELWLHGELASKIRILHDQADDSQWAEVIQDEFLLPMFLSLKPFFFDDELV